MEYLVILNRELFRECRIKKFPKRASVIFANHYLISKGRGFIVIPEKEVSEFKKLLVKYYEGMDSKIISGFLKERCWRCF